MFFHKLQKAQANQVQYDILLCLYNLLTDHGHDTLHPKCRHQQECLRPQKACPDLKGFNRRGLYRMKQFYETYSDDKFVTAVLSQIS